MKESKSSISKAKSYEEIGEFWDNHDLSEHWDETHAADFDVALKSETSTSVAANPTYTSSQTPTTKPVEVFYSYAHEDERLRDELKKHLANLKRQRVITDWYDRDISAGKEWDDEIKKHLDSASVILLLISPDFMNSDYSNDVEVKRAMERHEAGEARVIPIILRPVDWEGAPFSKLQGLPTDARAVTLWQNHDEAFLSVVMGIRNALEESTTRSDHGLSLTNIPRPPVVGFVARRDCEGRDIVERLTEELAPEKNQLIALSGPGGVGKTTLAAESTRALSGRFGQHIVWISALGREDFALTTLLDEIATQLGRADLRPLALEPKTAEVQALIASAPTLVILDNFETIATSERTRCVEFLLHHAPCPALITTREKITSARNITIPVMSPEEADDFLQRLVEQASDPTAFAQLDRDRIMEASERNPLVLQWVMGQIDLAQEADTVLDELVLGVGDAAQRVFDRSFELEQLGDDGRATLLALSLFAPDASRAALTEVAGFGADLKRLNEAVKRLAGLWLVKTASGSRLTVEGLTRELAKARSSKLEHAGQFRQRFVAYFLTYAQSHAQTTPEDFDALEAEKDNVLSAMDVAFGKTDWQSVTQLMDAISFDGASGYLKMRGYWDEAVRRGEQALKAARNLANESEISRFSHNLAIVYQNRGHLAEAQRLYNESLDINKQLGNQGGIASSLHGLALLAQDQGELEEARRLYNQSLEINKRLGNQGGIANNLHGLAWLAQGQGEPEEARRLYNQSLEINKRLGNQGGIASSLHGLALLAQGQGELEEARRLYNQSLEINKRLGNQNFIAANLHELAWLAQGQGKLEEARRLYNQSLEIQERLGHQSAIASSLHQLALLAQGQSEPEEARRLYNQSLEINKRLGNQRGIAKTFHNLAAMAQDQGELEEARRLYNQSLEINKRLGNQGGIANNLHELAWLAQGQGEPEEARRLYNQSLEINKRLGNQGGIAKTFHNLAAMAQGQGELEEARRLYNESLEINKGLGSQGDIAGSLHQLGRLAEKEADHAEAAQLFGEALAIFEKLKSPNAEVARRDLERVKAKSH